MFFYSVRLFGASSALIFEFYSIFPFLFLFFLYIWLILYLVDFIFGWFYIWLILYLVDFWFGWFYNYFPSIGPSVQHTHLSNEPQSVVGFMSKNFTHIFNINPIYTNSTDYTDYIKIIKILLNCMSCQGVWRNSSNFLKLWYFILKL